MSQAHESSPHVPSHWIYPHPEDPQGVYCDGEQAQQPPSQIASHWAQSASALQNEVVQLTVS